MTNKAVTDERLLNRLEHHLLSMQMDDREPLFILYSDTMRDVPGATLDLILEALVRLVRLRLIECMYYGPRGARRPCPGLTLSRLKRHCAGRSEEELREHPDGEFYFEPTPEGRIEDARDIYNDYYPDSK